MPWFRVDDGFHSHPKRLAVPLAAVGLWTVAGSWSSAHLTDGFVPDNLLPLLSPDAPELARELVAAGLWKRRKGGYQFHDWAARNPSRTAVEAARKNNAKRQEEWRAKQKAAGQDQERNGVTDGVTDDVTNSAPDPDPDPDPEDQKIDPLSPPSASTSPKGGRQRPATATRIPEDFTVTPEMVAWARSKVPRVDGKSETENFIDYWTAAGGPSARKRDWTAAWRYWMRTADHYAAGRPQQRKSRTQEVDELFADNYELARTLDARETGIDPRGNGHAHPVHQGALPPAGN